MRKRGFTVLMLLGLLIASASGCSVLKGNQKDCGCPSKKGMVGY